ncbi:MAG: hypothetical protein LBC84_00775 [Prevotellaceae bacterium]|jgi:hypothetical protein|nr:hypothetical protein [Prevotellaceae bacterium]
MTKAQIEEAANVYAENSTNWICCREAAEDAFLNGALSRQPEIDDLQDNIRMLKATLDIEVNMIQPQLKEQILMLQMRDGQNI